MKLPRFDQRVEHPEPELNATYGWVMDLGKTGLAGADDNADFVIGSINKNIGAATDAGKAYVVQGPVLALPDSFNTLAPAVVQQGGQFGRLKVTIGDVRGFASDPDDAVNLVFVPAVIRTMDLTACNQGMFTSVGAIDVFDMTDPDGNLDPYITTITPPPLPGQTSGLPCNVSAFGHWSDIGDVDGDGVADLVVGAVSSDEEQGRVYIFFGNPDFMEDPAPGTNAPGWLTRWAVIFPPDGPGLEPPFVRGANFGWSLSVADLDGDGKAEVAVARIEKSIGPGRVHVFHGAWIQSQVGHEPVTVIRPDGPADIDTGVPGIYETLIDNDVIRPNETNAGFGWVVSLKGGDLGMPGATGLDTRPDVLVHSEGAASIDMEGLRIVDTGGLFLYFNDSPPGGGLTLVDEVDPVKLMAPRINDASGDPIYGPQKGERFSRAFEVVDWQRIDGSTTRLLLVGAPDRDVTDPQIPTVLVERAGAVFAFEPPIPFDFDPHDLFAPHINAWDDFVFLEPDDGLAENAEADLSAPGAMSPQPFSLWGGWIVGGRYDSDLLLPGDQVGISARSREIGGVNGVGRVYTASLQKEAP